jgi:hypothetical protein
LSTSHTGGSSFSRSFSSSHSRSLAPAATATANGPPQDPRSYLNLRPLHADCLGTQTKRTTDHFWSTAQSSNNSVKWHRAGPNPPRPTISYALQDYPTLYPFSHRHSLGGSQPTCYSSKARERPSLSLPRTANVMFKPKPLLLEDDRSTTFAPGARNREDDVRMMVVVLVVVALAVDPPPWTPDPRPRNSHTANPASALQENGAQFCAYDQKAGLSFPMQSCIRILQGSAASTCDSVHARESGRDPRPVDSISNKQKLRLFPGLLTPQFTPPRWSCGP